MLSQKMLNKFIIISIIFILFIINFNCSTHGLISEKFPEEFYHIPKQIIPDEPQDKNPSFIIYGDSRPGWRIEEFFLRKETWLNWKMFIFPFYELYCLGNGIVGSVNWLRKVPDYGKKERLWVRDGIYDEAKRSDIDFIINGGDMPTDGRYPAHWATFIKENKIDHPMIRDFPFIPVVGNHEHANDKIYGSPNYDAIFDYPRFFVLDFPDASLFILDSDLIIDQYQDIEDDEQDRLFEKWFVGNDESSWLERELRKRDKTFKIIIMHHPPISFGKHHKDWSDPSWGRNLIAKRDALLQLFYQHKIQLALCSHDHFYQHNIVRMKDKNGQHPLDIHFIITGGGGVPLRELSDEATIQQYLQNYKEAGLDVRLINQAKIYHYCQVAVKKNEISIKVQEVTGNKDVPTRLVEEIRIDNKY